jgi:Family of unknown function (DUF6152)
MERMQMRGRLIGVIAGMMLYLAAVLAHSALSAEHDRGRWIELKGVVTKVTWLNPHIRFDMDVKDDLGKITNWEFELGSANDLKRAGWSGKLREGDVVVVSGIRAKNASNLVNAKLVTLPEGRRLSGMSPTDEPAVR